MPDTRTTAQKNRSIRQEALREQLANQGHLQYISENIAKLEDADTELDATQVQRLKYATEARIKLLGKYLPDLKSTELTGEGGDDLPNITVRLVDGHTD